VLGDFLTHPLGEGAFDAVVAIESTEHMASPEAFFARAAGLLRPGGRLVVCAWLSCEAPSPRAVRHLLEPIVREGRLAYLGTARECGEWIEGAGLVPLRFDDVSANVARTWTVCLGRLARHIAFDARYRRYLRDATATDRAFVPAMVRIRAAYATGAMRCGIFTAERPA